MGCDGVYDWVVAQFADVYTCVVVYVCLRDVGGLGDGGTGGFAGEEFEDFAFGTRGDDAGGALWCATEGFDAAALKVVGGVGWWEG